LFGLIHGIKPRTLTWTGHVFFATPSRNVAPPPFCIGPEF
jgi:hypothetical protein